MSSNYNNDETFGLSLSQSDIYFDQLKEQQKPLYNIGGYIQLKSISVTQLQAAHKRLIQSQDIFGIRLTECHGETVQYISEQRDTQLPLVDFSQAQNPQVKADEWLTQLFTTCMAFNDCDLYQFYLLKLSAQDFRYVSIAHHTMIDGWGFSNLCRNLADCYQDLDFEPAEQVNWIDIVKSDQQYIQSDKYQKDKDFWLNQTGLKQTQLFQPHYQFLLSKSQQQESQRQIIEINPQLQAKLEQTAKQLKVNDSHLYLAVIATYFYRVYGREQIRVGLPVHNRRNRLQKQALGVYVGVNPLVIDVKSGLCHSNAVGPSIACLSQAIAKLQQKAFRHHRTPIGHIISSLGTQSVYDFTFNYLALTKPLTFEGFDSPLVYLSHNRESLPLKFNLWKNGETAQTQLQIDHNLSYFHPDEACQLGLSIVNLLEQVVEQPHGELDYLNVLTEQQYQHYTACQLALDAASVKPLKHNQSNSSVSRALLLHQLFESQAQKTPFAIACSDRLDHLDYGSLNDKANDLAASLSMAGVKSGDIVAVCLKRTVNIPVAVLAILKLGAAYVPLDPNYPLTRLSFIINDCQPRLIITQTQLQGLVEQLVDQVDVERIFVDRLEPVNSPESKTANTIKPTDRAYLIYTSGSTGQPKAVELTHQNSVAMIHWASKTFESRELQTVLASTSLNFDLSVFELFVPLCTGGQCLLVNDVLELLESPQDISLINTVPSAASTLLEHNAIKPQVEVINLAGEPLSQTLVNQIFAQTKVKKVYNLYGPTEDTVYSAAKCFVRPIDNAPSIGKPVDQTRFYVVNEQEQLLPAGVAGQLFISGACVAKGYFNQPEKTAQKFIDDPFDLHNPFKVYKTGDMVRQLPNGEFQFLGRTDDQVKVRGFRIELGEISTVIGQLENVDQVVVMAAELYSDTDVNLKQAADQRQIIAFITKAPNRNTQLAELIQDVREHCQKQLPMHMVPAKIEVVSELPLMPNGKVDKKALLANISMQASATQAQTENQTQVQLSQIWANVLALDVNLIGADSIFFELGGHSLQTVKMRNQLNQHFAISLTLAEVFACNNLRTLALAIEQAVNQAKTQTVDMLDKSSLAATSQTQSKAQIPLSFAQHNLWNVCQIPQMNRAYNMAAAFKVTKGFDLTKAARAFDAIVQNHHILRTCYYKEGDTVWQRVMPHQSFTITEHDGRGFEQKQQHQWVREQANSSFDLSQQVLLKVDWLHTANHSDDAHQNAGVLVINLHHIACDGWSVELLLAQFKQCYLHQDKLDQNKLDQEGLHQVVTAPALQYSDYCFYQQKQQQHQQLNDDRAYWLAQLQDLPVLHQLPTHFNRAKAQGAPSALYTSEVEALPLLDLAKAHQLTPFMLIHSALALVLAKFSGQSDIVIGTPSSNRFSQAFSEVIGCFVNPIVLRLDTSTTHLNQYLQQVKSVNLAAQQHAGQPFTQLVNAFKGHSSALHSPLFQIMLSVEEQTIEQIQLGDALLKQIDVDTQVAKFDLNIVVKKQGDQWQWCWIYNQALFEQELIAQMAKHLNQVLANMVAAKPTTLSSQINLLSQSATNELIYQLNPPATQIDPKISIHQMFEHQALKHPDAIAVIDENQQLSYQTLNQQANQLARYMASMQVTAGDVVAIGLSREVNCCVAMLASLKLGAAYMFIDINYPQERLENQLIDAKPRLLLTDTKRLPQLDFAQSVVTMIAINEPQLTANFDKQNLDVVVKGQDDAYVIYTSGSTGKPKGVVCRHQSVINLLADFQHRKAITVGSQCALWTNLTFDVSVYEMFSALCYGATLHLVPEHLRTEPVAWFKWLAANNINSAFIPAFYLVEFNHWLADNVGQSVLTRLLVGVEPIERQLLVDIQSAVSGLQIINGYGPSETTICSALYNIDVTATEPFSDITPIGQAAANTRLLVLDSEQNLCPKGAVGELYIAGLGLGSGYLHQAQLTAERFIEHPLAIDGNDNRLYRTGDLVRWQSNGQMMFVGRVDEQVKVRGFRIELGEVISQLLKQPLVVDAHVIKTHIAGNEALVGFVKLVSDDIDDNAQPETICADIHSQLAKVLPVFMLPSRLMALEQFPLLPNGKLDKKAFYDIEIPVAIGRAPQTDTEQQLVAIFTELLEPQELDLQQKQALDIDSSFYALGGNSLLLAKLINRISSQFNIAVDAKTLLTRQTIAQIASYIDLCIANESSNNPLVIKPAGLDERLQAGLSSAQLRVWLVEKLLSPTNQNNIVGGVSIQGQLQLDIVKQAFNQLAEKHPMLRAEFSTRQELPQQHIAAHSSIALQYHDLTENNGQTQQQFKLICAEHAEQIIDIEEDNLVSGLLIKLATDSWYLQCNFHHIIFDGWSVSLFINQFMSAYQCIAQGKVSGKSEASAISYLDYVNWQQQFLTSNACKAQKQFWTEQLVDCPNPLNLSFAQRLSSTEPARSGSIVHKAWISASLMQSIQSLAALNNGSLFCVLSASLAILLGRLCGQNDVIIGTASAGRHQAGLDEVIGNFVNSLPIRTKLDLQQSFADLLASHTDTINGVIGNADLPIETIEQLASEHSPNLGNGRQAGLFSVMLNLLELPQVQLSNDYFSASFTPNPVLDHKFAMSLYLSPSEQGIEVACHFDQKRFDSKALALMLNQWAALLAQLVANQDIACGDYALPSADVRLPDMVKPLTTQYFSNEYLADLDSQPINIQKVAIECGNTSLTYAQLNQQVNLLASTFSQHQVVAIMAKRDERLIIAILAVLKAGACFVLLDPTTPKQRLEQQLALCHSDKVLDLNEVESTINQANGAADKQVTSSAADKHVTTSANDIAYLAFTTGTSGTPKLVKGTYSSLNAYIPWLKQHFGLHHNQRFGMLSGLTHDPLLRDIFTPLALGATLCIPPASAFEYGAMGQWLADEQINSINITPSLAEHLLASDFDLTSKEMLSEGEPKQRSKQQSEQQLEQQQAEPQLNLLQLNKLTHIFFGGERLTQAVVDKITALAANAQLVNLYGATETGRALAFAQGANLLSLGQGMADTQLLVLNQKRQLCAVGEVGEIAIRAGHMPLGYYQDDGLTAQKFIANPYQGESSSTDLRDCIYLTGDMGRFGLDGMVHYIGRQDSQVKIRGFRVECQEIEQALTACADVVQALVRVYQQQLVAFVVIQNGNSTADAELSAKLRRELSQSLPSYMLPSNIVQLKQMPLNASNKIDEQQLQSYLVKTQPRSISKANSDTEKTVLSQWQQLLGKSSISIDDNFFDLGGHSLLASQFFVRVQHQWQVKLSYQTFFANATISDIAKVIDHQVEAKRLNHKLAKVSKTNQLSKSKKSQKVSL